MKPKTRTYNSQHFNKHGFRFTRFVNLIQQCVALVETFRSIQNCCIKYSTQHQHFAKMFTFLYNTMLPICMVTLVKWVTKNVWPRRVYKKNVPVRILGTRFEARNCFSEPGPQDTYLIGMNDLNWYELHVNFFTQNNCKTSFFLEWIVVENYVVDMLTHFPPTAWQILQTSQNISVITPLPPIYSIKSCQSCLNMFIFWYSAIANTAFRPGITKSAQ
jgi:hypothetical protein